MYSLKSIENMAPGVFIYVNRAYLFRNISAMDGTKIVPSRSLSEIGALHVLHARYSWLPGVCILQRLPLPVYYISYTRYPHRVLAVEYGLIAWVSPYPTQSICAPFPICPASVLYLLRLCLVPIFYFVFRPLVAI